MPKNCQCSFQDQAEAWTFEAKAIEIGLEAPRGQGAASKTTSLVFIYFN